MKGTRPLDNNEICYNHELLGGGRLLLGSKLAKKYLEYPKDPQEKADDYRQTGLLSAGEVAETICKYGWGEAQIEDRDDEITSWIYNEFL